MKLVEKQDLYSTLRVFNSRQFQSLETSVYMWMMSANRLKSNSKYPAEGELCLSLIRVQKHWEDCWLMSFDLTVVQKTIIAILHKEGKGSIEAARSQSTVIMPREGAQVTGMTTALKGLSSKGDFKNAGSLPKKQIEAWVSASRVSTYRRATTVKFHLTNYSSPIEAPSWGEKKIV